MAEQCLRIIKDGYGRGHSCRAERDRRKYPKRHSRARWIVSGSLLLCSVGVLALFFCVSGSAVHACFAYTVAFYFAVIVPDILWFFFTSVLVGAGTFHVQSRMCLQSHKNAHLI